MRPEEATVEIPLTILVNIHNLLVNSNKELLETINNLAHTIQASQKQIQEENVRAAQGARDNAQSANGHDKEVAPPSPKSRQSEQLKQ